MAHRGVPDCTRSTMPYIKTPASPTILDTVVDTCSILHVVVVCVLAWHTKDRTALYHQLLVICGTHLHRASAVCSGFCLRH